MTHYFTACLQSEADAVVQWLKDQRHAIVETLGPFDSVWLQRTDGIPKVCCSQAGQDPKMVIHSQKSGKMETLK